MASMNLLNKNTGVKNSCADDLAFLTRYLWYSVPYFYLNSFESRISLFLYKKIEDQIGAATVMKIITDADIFCMIEISAICLV